MRAGQQASGVFLFFSSSEASAAAVPASTPSSNVRLLLWPEWWNYSQVNKYYKYIFGMRNYTWVN